MTKGEEDGAGAVTRGLRLKEVVEAGANLRNGDWKGGDLVGEARVRGNVGFTDRRDAAAMVWCCGHRRRVKMVNERNAITSGVI